MAEIREEICANGIWCQITVYFTLFGEKLEDMVFGRDIEVISLILTKHRGFQVPKAFSFTFTFTFSFHLSPSFVPSD